MALIWLQRLRNIRCIVCSNHRALLLALVCWRKRTVRQATRSSASLTPMATRNVKHCCANSMEKAWKTTSFFLFQVDWTSISSFAFLLIKLANSQELWTAPQFRVFHLLLLELLTAQRLPCLLRRRRLRHRRLHQRRQSQQQHQQRSLWCWQPRQHRRRPHHRQHLHQQQQSLRYSPLPHFVIKIKRDLVFFHKLFLSIFIRIGRESADMNTSRSIVGVAALLTFRRRLLTIGTRRSWMRIVLLLRLRSVK